jgi:hypothetical protein
MSLGIHVTDLLLSLQRFAMHNLSGSGSSAKHIKNKGDDPGNAISGARQGAIPQVSLGKMTILGYFLLRHGSGRPLARSLPY